MPLACPFVSLVGGAHDELLRHDCQARYSLGDGRARSAPETFATEAEGERYLATVETELARDTWLDPSTGEIRLDAYAPRWLTERPVELQPRTAEIYEHLLRRHIYPTFGSTPLNRITSASVRSWNASLRDAGVGAVTAAKAYRLLKAILATAAEDEPTPTQQVEAGG